MIRQMATETSVMLIKSLEAFAQRDRVKAEWVIDRDDVVDDLFDAVKGELIGAIRQKRGQRRGGDGFADGGQVFLSASATTRPTSRNGRFSP